MSKDITKVRIQDGKVEIHWNEHLEPSEENGNREIDDDKSVKTNRLPHPDFTNALAGLRLHMIDILELHGGMKTSQVTVTCVSFTGLDSDEGARVQIEGTKPLSKNRVFEMKTPKYPLENEKLDKACKRLVDEAWDFIAGKTGFTPQSEIDFGKNGNGKENE